MLTKKERQRLEEIEQDNKRIVSFVEGEREMIEEYMAKIKKLELFFGIGKIINKDKIQEYGRLIQARAEHIKYMLSNRADITMERAKLLVKESLPKGKQIKKPRFI